MDTYMIWQVCPNPLPGASDLAAWGALDGGSATSVISVGLFGYDITCLANYCALQTNDNEYCPFIEARGLDGLAFGVHFEIDTGSSNFYCAGFHNEEFTDIAACTYSAASHDVYTLYWTSNYTVAEDYFSGTTPRHPYSTGWGYYGLGEWQFYETNYDVLSTTDVKYNSAFRFIGASENGGNRWSVGDEIDLFYLEFENPSMTENEGFELAGAATLTLAASGIALISAVMM